MVRCGGGVLPVFAGLKKYFGSFFMIMSFCWRWKMGKMGGNGGGSTGNGG
jgi:hypothetical protein